MSLDLFFHLISRSNYDILRSARRRNIALRLGNLPTPNGAISNALAACETAWVASGPT